MAKLDLNWIITLQVCATDAWQSSTSTGLSPFRCVQRTHGQARPQLDYHPSGVCNGRMAKLDINWIITLQGCATDAWPSSNETGLSRSRCVHRRQGQAQKKVEHDP